MAEEERNPIQEMLEQMAKTLQEMVTHTVKDMAREAEESGEGIAIEAKLDDNVLFWIAGPAVFGVRTPRNLTKNGKLTEWHPPAGYPPPDTPIPN